LSRNIEIKARVEDLEAVEARARGLTLQAPIRIQQDDTFFACAKGRLKLREFEDGSGELIHYLRADVDGPKVSDYVVVPAADPEALRQALTRACGVLGRVRKQRTVYLVDRTRVHLDRVEGLGHFVELEVVLAESEEEDRGQAVAADLLQALGIAQGQCIAGAYFDLLQASQ
jgi:predicted adenylyl cyclase CyaB